MTMWLSSWVTHLCNAKILVSLLGDAVGATPLYNDLVGAPRHHQGVGQQAFAPSRLRHPGRSRAGHLNGITPRKSSQASLRDDIVTMLRAASSS